MAYYNICPICGNNLDPGEKCDCEDEKASDLEFYRRHLKMGPAKQLTFVFDEEGSHERKINC